MSNNPAVLTPNNCLLRGIAGTYTRASADVDWRRTLYTNNGQVITPFLRVRGDVASLEAQNAPGMSNYINTGQTEPARFMPAAGVEYRYPFVDVEPWGTQTVEPIAQLILRPNETEIGSKIPNEDAQSLSCPAPPTCSRSTSFPAGTASRAAAASMPGCSTPLR